eukprot:CAMPEP_0182862996 /NCGR_PEP_ID=MMETSP0034_2-20130328/6396_1 /TAXON_ID=156128 /ORGANISM="Nephroselmis pyriformis, Strain CCMP717" /LENGTH=41 /DNA_ID= /DNA_START= /DNA_END= /DNA_ORIENTATION=
MLGTGGGWSLGGQPCKPGKLAQLRGKPSSQSILRCVQYGKA